MQQQPQANARHLTDAEIDRVVGGMSLTDADNLCRELGDGTAIGQFDSSGYGPCPGTIVGSGWATWNDDDDYYGVYIEVDENGTAWFCIQYSVDNPGGEGGHFSS